MNAAVWPWPRSSSLLQRLSASAASRRRGKQIPPAPPRICEPIAPVRYVTCQWPHGLPRAPGFHLCGAATKPGRPYCEAHCAIAYLPAGTEPEF